MFMLQGTQPGEASQRTTRRRLDWAKLLARVWEVDVLACPRCAAAMQRIAFVTHPKAIAAILRSVGLPTAPPRRAPPEGEEISPYEVEPPPDET